MFKLIRCSKELWDSQSIYFILHRNNECDFVLNVERERLQLTYHFLQTQIRRCKFFNSFLTNLLLIAIRDNLAVNKKAKPFS